MSHCRVENMDHLKELCADKRVRFFIRYKYDLISSKIISYYDPIWCIDHIGDCISFIYQNDKEFKNNEELLFKGLKKNILYKY